MIGERKISTVSLLFLACFLLGLSRWHDRIIESDPWHAEKLEAARIMLGGIGLIREEALRRGVVMNPDFDPNQTGLIGPEVSPLVTEIGTLDTKLVVTNPNLAAAFVEMFREARLDRGDSIAVAWTGSYPGVNLAILSAAKVLGLRPVIITSLTSSHWGATDPRLTWLDMEKVLWENGITHARSFAASLGRTDFIAQNLRPEGRRIVEVAVSRNSPLIFVMEKTIQKSIAKRLELYEQGAEGAPIKAFVNVGVSRVILGHQYNDTLLRQGLNLTVVDSSKFYSYGVLTKMSEKKIPIIHIRNVREVIRAYGLSEFPVPLPLPGYDGVFRRRQSHWVVTSVAALLSALAIALAVSSEPFLKRFKAWRWLSQKTRNL